MNLVKKNCKVCSWNLKKNSCYHGYFPAVRKVTKNMFSSEFSIFLHLKKN